MEASEYLKPFMGCTAQQRATFTDGVIQAYNDGWMEPMSLLSAIKNLQAILTDLETFVKPEVLEHLEQNGGKDTAQGIKVERMEGGTKYDYSGTGDVMYGSLLQLAKNATDKVKEREQWLKTIPDGGIDIVDDSSGELVKVYKPIKSSTTTYKVSLV